MQTGSHHHHSRWRVAVGRPQPASSLAQQLANRGYVCFTRNTASQPKPLYPAARTRHKDFHPLGERSCEAIRGGYEQGVVVLGFSAGGQLAALIGNTNGQPFFEGITVRMLAAAPYRPSWISMEPCRSYIRKAARATTAKKNIGGHQLVLAHRGKTTRRFGSRSRHSVGLGPIRFPTLFINSSVARMHAGRNDYIDIPAQNNIYTGSEGIRKFPHHFCLFNPWFQ